MDDRGKLNIKESTELQHKLWSFAFKIRGCNIIPNYRRVEPLLVHNRAPLYKNKILPSQDDTFLQAQTVNIEYWSSFAWGPRQEMVCILTNKVCSEYSKQLTKATWCGPVLVHWLAISFSIYYIVVPNLILSDLSQSYGLAKILMVYYLSCILEVW